jgi:hypothetical protein
MHQQSACNRPLQGREALVDRLECLISEGALGAIIKQILEGPMHGGSTWNSSVNRDQIRDCGNLLGKLVPLVIEIMMDNVNTLWGDACYPVVD